MRINAVDPSNLFPPTAVAPSTYRKMCAGDNRGRRESPEERVREERETEREEERKAGKVKEKSGKGKGGEREKRGGRKGWRTGKGQSEEEGGERGRADLEMRGHLSNFAC